jgi:murein DD-endopeptidase MepM/ murein hydrolase activator NlpD
MMPLIGPITGGFGLIRYINGDPSSSHAGLDIGAVSGTQVLAANDGKVALVMDMFFSGLSLFIDHGQGLYTMYFHLSDVLVKEGDVVKRGEKIALVGATGRVTGPHLHFAVRLNTNKVNPYGLVDKRF